MTSIPALPSSRRSAISGKPIRAVGSCVFDAIEQRNAQSSALKPPVQSEWLLALDVAVRSRRGAARENARASVDRAVFARGRARPGR